MPRSRRLYAVAAGAALVAVPALVTAAPAAADHTPLPTRVTLMGSLMSELGCDSDWSESCTKTDLLAVPGSPGLFAKTFTVPAGDPAEPTDYVYKVRLNGSWSENYGDATFGLPDGNIPLAIEETTTLRFTYDHATHRVRVGPARPAGGPDRCRPGDGARQPAQGPHPRALLLRDGRPLRQRRAPRNDTAAITGDPARAPGSTRPAKGFYHGGDLKGLHQEARLHRGPRHHRDLDDAVASRTSRSRAQPARSRPATTATGSPTSPRSTRTSAPTPSSRRSSTLAHQRGIKVFFDIITNHTADVIDYPDSAYDATGQVPYKTKAGRRPTRTPSGNAVRRPRLHVHRRPVPRGRPRGDASPTSRPSTTRPTRPSRCPAWLNDPTMYHNRGTSTFSGENSEYGDFPSGNRSALDDLWTERPEVVQGMIDIYKTWVEQAGVDGFRIDTVKHVNMEFWQQFAPGPAGPRGRRSATRTSSCSARSTTPTRAFMSQYTTDGQAAGDASTSASRAAASTSPRASATTELRDFFALDDYFTDADSNAYSLPTFLGNHDMGRIGSFLRDDTEGGPRRSCCERDELAHSLMYLTRGQPVVYYGDEQGFGTEDVPGGIGTSAPARTCSPARSRCTTTRRPDRHRARRRPTTTSTPRHPLYRHIADLAELREQHPALADGAQIAPVRHHRARHLRVQPDGSGREGRVRRRRQQRRHDADGDLRHLPAGPQHAQGRLARLGAAQPQDRHRGSRHGHRPAAVGGRLQGDLEAAVPTATLPEPTFTAPGAAGIVTGRAEVGVTVPGGDFTQVTFAWRPVGDEEVACARHRRQRPVPGVPRRQRRWPRARRSSTARSPGTTTTTSAWCRPARSSASPSHRPTPGWTSARSPSRMRSRCRAATAARSGAVPTGTRRATTSS